MKTLYLMTSVMFLLSAAGSTVCGAAEYADPNTFSGSDSERINQAVAAAKKHNGIVRIFPRKPDSVSSRDFWLLDSAILVPGDTTLILENCRLKLSDQCRDNFFRSANCVPGLEKLEHISNLHIIGRGNAVLEGADHPRSTGDGNGNRKRHGAKTYGTDIGKKEVKEFGDWRNIGILLAEVDHFTLENLTIRDSHAWAISLEHCSYGRIRNLEFLSRSWKMIDGKKEPILNQDGLDLRHGCHDIVIENITGTVGDDLIALTTLRGKVRKSGIGGMEFTGKNPVTHLNDIRNIIIRNVRGYSSGPHNIVRFLSAGEIGIHGILLDGVLDTSPETNPRGNQAVKVGDVNFGKANPGSCHGFIIRNVRAVRNRCAVRIDASLRDSVISGVICENPDREIIELTASPAERNHGLIFDSLLKISPEPGNKE